MSENIRPENQASSDILDPAAIRAGILPGQIGHAVEFYHTIDSTNTRAKQLAAQGAPHGMIVLADSQSAGRGRFARRFHSPQGSGIYLSAILRPQIAPERAVQLTCMAAVAVARAIEAVAHVPAQIKWVNDVYVQGRKACGILCEAGLNFADGCMDYVVMGIGVNVGPMAFPGELADVATSLSNACGRPVRRSEFLTALLKELDALYAGLESAAFMDEYRSRSMVVGRDVDVLRGQERFCAHVLDVCDDGSLSIRRPDGQVERLNSGEISVRLK